jgi:hypothetical protein
VWTPSHDQLRLPAQPGQAGIHARATLRLLSAMSISPTERHERFAN